MAHNLRGSRNKNLVDSIPSSLIVNISPGITSRSNVAPIILKAHVSDATTYASPKRPNDRGRIPRGSSATYILPSVKIIKAYAPINCFSAEIFASSSGLTLLCLKLFEKYFPVLLNHDEFFLHS